MIRSKLPNNVLCARIKGASFDDYKATVDSKKIVFKTKRTKTDKPR